jgi:hypothetical protein
MPRLKLADLLRRRKMTLKQFLQEFGITTYDGMLIRCHRMGVEPPTEADYALTCPPRVSSPTEGVIVLEAPNVIDELTGRPIDPEGPASPSVVVKWSAANEPDPVPIKDTQRKQRKKKDDQSDPESK